MAATIFPLSFPLNLWRPLFQAIIFCSPRLDYSVLYEKSVIPTAATFVFVEIHYFLSQEREPGLTLLKEE